jgi:hypothetical protein
VSVAFRGRQRTVRPVASLLVVGGLAGVFTGVAVAVGMVTYPPIWAALALAYGGLAAWHGARHLASSPGSLRGPSLTERTLVFGVVAPALFWSTAAYSQQIGEQLARSIDSNPANQPEVTIHSAEDLNLWPEPGTVAEQGKFPYTCRGFRLLTYANDRWFLLSGERTASGRHSSFTTIVAATSARRIVTLCNQYVARSVTNVLTPGRKMVDAGRGPWASRGHDANPPPGPPAPGVGRGATLLALRRSLTAAALRTVVGSPVT